MLLSSLNNVPRVWRCWIAGALVGVCFSLELRDASAQEQHSFVLQANMDVLRCTLPNESDRFVSSNAPGQVLLPEEAARIQLELSPGKEGASAEMALEIQEITTRDPEAKIKEVYTDTAGHAPRIGLAGKPVVHPFKVAFEGAEKKAVTIDNLPIPARFGTYALILVRGEQRQFLATMCRVPHPRASSNLENTPIFGEFAIFDQPERFDQRAATYQRMGVRGMRLETSWSENQEGQYDFSRTDAIFTAAAAHQLQLMVTLGGNPSWTWPFGPHKQTPASVGPTWDGNPYWGQADWLAEPKYYPRYGTWITAFCKRYWKGGQGALWGLENYNEPWEGGGISGWARDCLQYREIQKLIAESARKVDPRIKICAASSIMNTEDKLYSNGTRDFDKYVDVFTDHYVVPPMCYGPMVAQAHGKESVETETWFVNSEYLLPQIVQFLAAGQSRLSPWHPRVLFDRLPGTQDEYFIPTPVIAATAAFNSFLSGKKFEKLVFHDHLPWVFQFGADGDREGLLVVFGQLMTIAGDSPRERLWAQVEGSAGGTITIENQDGLLKFYDLAGNPEFVGQPQVVLPLSIYPAYVTSDKGPAAAAERLKAAKIEGKRPVEILPHEFTSRVDAKHAVLNVTVHNCLNRAIKGKLEVKTPAELTLVSTELPVQLEAGERKTLEFKLASAKPNAANAYPCEFHFASDAGEADYAEIKNLAIVPKGTKTIDGNLDDWKEVPGVTVLAEEQKAEVTELLRRPWLELKDQLPDGSFAEFKIAWDDDYLYFAARVNDATPQVPSPRMADRDVNQYFHTGASDSISPYKEFLKEFPGRSFGNVPYVYRNSPERPIDPKLPFIHFRRDRLHIALDVTADWHDLTPTTDRVPEGFHAVPDTDYEYACYLCSDGGAELWRLLAPGLPRIHDFPRTLRGSHSTGPVPAAKQVVIQDGRNYTYEVAIPKQELANLKLQPGSTFGVMLRAGNDQGPHVDYGANKAVTKVNGLSLHPYWERSSNCGVRWTLVE